MSELGLAQWPPVARLKESALGTRRFGADFGYAQRTKTTLHGELPQRARPQGLPSELAVTGPGLTASIKR